MTDKRPFFLIVPGASQNGAHYGYLSHLLMEAGFPVFMGLLPSVGSRDANATAEQDAIYVREKLILPVLNEEKRDVILVMHSYSSIPGSAAAKGLSKAERNESGQGTNGVIGQIFIAALLPKGDPSGSLVKAIGKWVGVDGPVYPPHIIPEPESNILRCEYTERVRALFGDVRGTNGESNGLQDGAAVASMAQSLKSFDSPIPEPSWSDTSYRGRVAYFRTVNDKGIAFPLQEQMLRESGVEWIIEDIESEHSPQLSQTRKLTEMLLDLASKFETT